MEVSVQTTTRPSFAAVNSPQNALTYPYVNFTSSLVTKDPINMSANTSPGLSSDIDTGSLEDILPNPPMADDEAGDNLDPEDMITVYTEKEDLNRADGSTNIHASASTDARPGYGSAASEGGDRHSLADARFFLESDIPFRAPSSRVTHSFLKEPSAEQSPVDSELYTKCMKCISHHVRCDRRVPCCSNCNSASECVYWKRAGFNNQNEAIQAYRASLLPAKKEIPRRASSFKPPKSIIKPEVSPLLPNTTIKDIEWLDGDISHSQKQCPSSITNMIDKHLVEFETLIATGLWSSGKTCYVDRGRESLFVDPQTDQDVPVARYRYGGSHQFFVVWLPRRDPSDGLEPAICKFRVYNNDGVVMRNGNSWVPVMWKTWVPQGVKYKAARDIIRYKRDAAPRRSWVPSPSLNASPLDVVDLDLNEPKRTGQLSAKRRSSALDLAVPKRARKDATLSNNKAQHGVHTPMRQTDRNAGQSGKENQKMLRERGPDGLFSGRPSLSVSVDEPTHSPATKPSTDIASPKPVARLPPPSSIVSELTEKGLDLSVSFQDSSGELRGTYPYDECNTAQKLFDVACVAQIAQIEPPATRLLKVKFDEGGEGRIRPDNEQDFRNVFEAELKKLVTGALGGGEFKVTISPYL